jgi:hypothetical protein
MRGVKYGPGINSKNKLIGGAGANLRCNMMAQPCMVIGGGEDDSSCRDIESVRIDDSDRLTTP